MWHWYKLDNEHDQKLLDRVDDLTCEDWDVVRNLADQCITHAGRETLLSLARQMHIQTEIDAGME